MRFINISPIKPSRVVFLQSKTKQAYDSMYIVDCDTHLGCYTDLSYNAYNVSAAVLSGLFLSKVSREVRRIQQLKQCKYLPPSIVGCLGFMAYQPL